MDEIVALGRDDLEPQNAQQIHKGGRGTEVFSFPYLFALAGIMF